MRYFSCILALLLASLAQSADLRQITPPAGQSLAVLEAPTSRGTWAAVRDEDLTTVAPQLLADGGIAILVGTPGRYLVRWRPGPLRPWLPLTVDLGIPPGPGPKPDDPPKPEPPKPEPFPAAVAMVVVVEETADPSGDVDLPAIRISGVSGEIAAWCKTNNVAWRVIDKDVKGPDGKTPAQFTAVLTEAKDKHLPWLFGITKTSSDGTADLVVSERCPATVSGVLELLKKRSGK